jgi:ribosomal protein S18 acetylase RimI-like enzyme
MTAMHTRFAQVTDAHRLAELHATRIGTGFLASLGPAFLTRLYQRISRSPRAFAFVADDGAKIVAFCAAAEDVRRFYVEFIARDGLISGLRAAPRIVRAVPRVVETMKYPATRDRALPPAEILAVVTDEAAATRGVGRMLVRHTLCELQARGCAAAKVVAGADNQPALRLYEGCGFVPHARISVHEGVPSEVLVWASS